MLLSGGLTLLRRGLLLHAGDRTLLGHDDRCILLLRGEGLKRRKFGLFDRVKSLSGQVLGDGGLGGNVRPLVLDGGRRFDERGFRLVLDLSRRSVVLSNRRLGSGRVIVRAELGAGFDGSGVLARYRNERRA